MYTRIPLRGYIYHGGSSVIDNYIYKMSSNLVYCAILAHVGIEILVPCKIISGTEIIKLPPWPNG